MTTTRAITQAYQALRGHRHHAYRGCAPDPDQPTQSAADPTVPLDAWGSITEDDVSATERTALRKAAVAICERCPVLDACRTYANLELPGLGGLVEPDGVWGGQPALDRHRALIARRTAGAALPDTQTPVTEDQLPDEARSTKRLQLLRALARDTDPELVAYRAGMDLRTANWQRAVLCTLLGFDKETASRQQLLEHAQTLRLLPASVRIVPDGPWPLIAAPSTDGIRQRRLAPTLPVQDPLPRLPRYQRALPTAPATVRPGRPRLRLVRPAPVQLPLPLSLPVRILEPAA